jgi:hypothetical protein
MGSVAARQHRRSYEWLLHACVIALVLIGHIAMLMIMLRPARPLEEEPTAVAPNERDAVQVRFIRRVLPKPPVPMQEPRAATVSHSASPTYHATRSVQTSHQASPSQSSTEPAPLVLTLPASNSSTYVAGGSPFQQNLQAADHPYAAKMPGGDQLRAPQFAMKDPRDQGVAGFVRFVRHYFPQMVDSHCVDVNTWAGMSPAEQAKHASLSEMKAIAEEYGCLEPERFPNTTH